MNDNNKVFSSEHKHLMSMSIMKFNVENKNKTLEKI